MDSHNRQSLEKGREMLADKERLYRVAFYKLICKRKDICGNEDCESVIWRWTVWAELMMLF